MNENYVYLTHSNWCQSSYICMQFKFNSNHIFLVLYNIEMNIPVVTVVAGHTEVDAVALVGVTTIVVLVLKTMDELLPAS